MYFLLLFSLHTRDGFRYNQFAIDATCRFAGVRNTFESKAPGIIRKSIIIPNIAMYSVESKHWYCTQQISVICLLDIGHIMKFKLNSGIIK